MISQRPGHPLQEDSQPFLVPAGAAQDFPDTGVFRHGIELGDIAGSQYADVVRPGGQRKGCVRVVVQSSQIEDERKRDAKPSTNEARITGPRQFPTLIPGSPRAAGRGLGL